MLTVANHTQDHSIVTGEYIHTVKGTHSITITVYSESCSGVFQPCEAGPAGLNAEAFLRVLDQGLTGVTQKR